MTMDQTMWVGEKNNVGVSLMTHMREEDLYYIGGLIDGDGSFYISVEEADTNFGYRVRPKFDLTQDQTDGTDKMKGVLLRFMEEYSISYYTREYEGSWRIQVSGKSNTVRLARKIEPYLKKKSEQAEIIISTNWPTAGNKSFEQRRDRFMHVIRQREKLRSMLADRDTKYTVDFFEGVFDL